MKSTLYALALILLFASCASEEPDLPNIFVEDAFEPYVESFISEGAKRGYNIDFEDTGLTIIFGHTPNASASCSEIAGHDHGSHQIMVNKKAWQTLNDSLRERLIFHELGHCELNRTHKNDKFADGSWQSIMRGDPMTEVDERLPIPYFGFRRDYFIDELFDEEVQAPDWANLNFDYHEIAMESRNVIVSQSGLPTLNDTVNLDLRDYELEFELRTISGTQPTWLAWGTEERHYFFWLQENEFHFSANSNFQGPFHFVKNEQYDFRQSQKVTIRQKGPFCKVFINEQFFFIVDRLPAELFFVMSSSENEIEIESYTLSEIL